MQILAEKLLFRAALVLIAALASAPVSAQLVLARLFDSGVATTVKSLPDGSTLVAGQFGYINGAQVTGELIRLTPEGSLDSSWSTSARNLNALEVATDGSILVGGGFTTVAGTPRPGFAKLSATGALLPWSLQPDEGEPALVSVSKFLELPGGDLLLVANAADGAQRLVRASAESGLYRTLFEFNGGVSTLLLLGDGSVILAGTLSEFDGLEGINLVRLLPGSLLRDASFGYAPTETVTAAAHDAFDRLYVAQGSQLLRVSATGAIDSGFAVSANASISQLKVDALDRVYVRGSFSQIGGEARNRIARILPTANGQVDPNWSAPAFSGGLLTLDVSATRVMVGGNLLSLAAQSAGLLTLDLDDGSTPQGYVTPRFGGSVVTRTLASIATADGGAVFSGTFTQTAEEIVPGLFKVDSQGVRVAGWQPDLSGRVQALVDAGDGFIYASVATAFGINSRVQLRRVFADSGQPDSSWQLELQNRIISTFAYSNGFLYFANYENSAFPGGSGTAVWRISTSAPATLDPDWQLIASAPILGRQILPLETGAVLMVGNPPFSGVIFDPPPPSSFSARIFAFDPAQATPQPLGPVVSPARGVFGLARKRNGELLTIVTGGTNSNPTAALIRLSAAGELIEDLAMDTGGRVLAGGPIALDSSELFLYVAGGDPAAVFPSGRGFLGRVLASDGRFDTGWTPPGADQFFANALSVQQNRVFAGGSADNAGDSVIGGFFSTAVAPLFADGFEPE